MTGGDSEGTAGPPGPEPPSLVQTGSDRQTYRLPDSAHHLADQAPPLAHYLLARLRPPPRWPGSAHHLAGQAPPTTCWSGSAHRLVGSLTLYHPAGLLHHFQCITSCFSFSLSPSPSLHSAAPAPSTLPPFCLSAPHILLILFLFHLDFHSFVHSFPLRLKT